MTQPTPAPSTPPPGYAGTVAFAVYETAVAAAVLAAFAAWFTTVVGLILLPTLAFGLPPDPTAIWQAVPAWEKQVDKLLDSLIPIARLGWEDTMSQFGLDIPFNVDDPVLQDTLQRTRNLMVRTPDEVYRLVLAELGQGTDLGETNQQLAARVRRVLDTTGTEYWPGRAKTVAVTEVHRAYNFGAYAAAQQAQQKFQQRMRKRWLAKDDAVTRPAHRAADGQTVPVGQPFQVGGEALIAPGDPSGSPWNVINCRCKMRFAWGTEGGR